MGAAAWLDVDGRLEEDEDVLLPRMPGLKKVARCCGRVAPGRRSVLIKTPEVVD